MNVITWYRAAIGYFGAHLIHQRGHHEADRAIQRAIIGAAISVLMMWYSYTTTLHIDPWVTFIPYLTTGYVAFSLIYLRVVQSKPDSAVVPQYLFIIADPVLTVLALACMPSVLAPLNQLLLVQIVRCGIRFGVRTLWLTWAATVVASLLLFPLNDFWSISEPLTRSYIAMLVITPLLFGPLIHRLHRVSADLRTDATSDPLTGLGNRRMLSEHLRLAQERSLRDRSMVALVMFDLDNFKAVNDTLGHGTGDHLLERVAAAIKSNSRGGDFLARIGGDEFVLLVEGLSEREGRAQAQAIAEKIVQTVEATATQVCPSIRVSASAGVHCWRSSSNELSAELDLIDVADRAMYSAKRAGKARVVLAPA